MYARVVYENSILDDQEILTMHTYRHLNIYVNEKLATGPNEVLIEDANKSVSLGLSADQEITPVSLDVKRAMLEAERKKAEALNMLRLRETLR